jgi:hypothetical protein
MLLKRREHATASGRSRASTTVGARDATVRATPAQAIRTTCQQR